tara:strand:- start:10497 stop:10643 length:147 start_codon:yes stop_codon:yes gene_type:complete
MSEDGDAIVPFINICTFSGIFERHWAMAFCDYLFSTSASATTLSGGHR